MVIYRRAHDDESDVIMDLVIRTFTGEQEIPLELNFLVESKEPRWFCADDQGMIIGTIAFFKENGSWHAGRFAIEPNYRGQRIGSALLTYALKEMFDSGAEEIVIEGRPTTVHILTKLGAQITGEAFPFYRSTCTPMRITRDQFQQER